MRSDINDRFQFLVFLGQTARELCQSLFIALALGDVRADGDILRGLSVGVEKWKNGCGHPIKRAVLGPVPNLPFPNLATGNCRPKILEKLLWMMSRVNDAMVLPEQLLA